MTNDPKPKFDLAKRTAQFAMKCRDLVKLVQQDVVNREYCKQLARSSGSVAANYLEADESLSKKDFVMRIKICRKEARESRLWLKLLLVDNTLASQRDALEDEAYQLVKIFNAIVNKST